VNRQWFAILLKTPSESLTDIQRAARYFYLQKSAYGGMIRRQSYAIHVVQRPNFSTARIASLIRQSHERLQGVQIESLPYEEILKRYDRPTTLFYLTPRTGDAHCTATPSTAMTSRASKNGFGVFAASLCCR
jgi:DNA adenine methylase